MDFRRGNFIEKSTRYKRGWDKLIAVYAGLPAALNGLIAAKEVFDETERQQE